MLLEVNVPTSWAGPPLGELEVPCAIRLAALRRAGRFQVADPSVLAQEGDVVVVCVAGAERGMLEDVLHGPASRGAH